MDDRTMINPAIAEPEKTWVNSELAAWMAREADRPIEIAAGEVLLNEYTIVRRLGEPSGEADLYLAERQDGRQAVLKIYRSRRSIKPEVAELLREISSPYVAKMYEFGEYQGRFVEVVEHFEGGSVHGRTFSMEELCETIIPQINEGLRALHERNVIHKDLKPANIMLCGDGRSVALIDFGVSSLMESGQSVLMTRTGMTPTYAAPETFRDLYLVESDYYSFGVTLFELFTGHVPYEGMEQEEIERYAAIQRIPLPDEMPQRLKNLITALTYPDITNRTKKENPNRRWTHDEVEKWLRGENLPIPGGAAGRYGMTPFTFMGKRCEEMSELAERLAAHWEEGKYQLFRGHLTAHFDTCNPEAAGWCREAEAQSAREGGHDDRIFWRLIHQMAPKKSWFVWKGRIYENLPAFGRDMLEALWQGNEGQYGIFDSILSERMLSAYVQTKAHGEENMLKVAQALENQYDLILTRQQDRRRAYYSAAYTLSGQKIMRMDDREIRNISELSGYMRELLDQSLDSFRVFCHRLVDYDGNLDVQLEAWLIAIGKKEEIAKWRERIYGTVGE